MAHLRVEQEWDLKVESSRYLTNVMVVFLLYPKQFVLCQLRYETRFMATTLIRDHKYMTGPINNIKERRMKQKPVFI